ncbi:ASKHA domain-containing protein [Halofilum ochraceum]|uniref:ASKHA domain-containing protein n=1 Tax=Halofilum ochraceum TaxID=1611323 RepID=UPI0008DA2141|nr:ASKHA domain-containing protein [Halofilum ochraceum]
MAEEDALVVFSPSGRRGRFPIGTPVLQAARALGVDIDSVCGGRGLCGRCQVLVSEGEFPKYGLESRPEHLTEFSETERDYEAQVGKLKVGRRLSCSTKVLGDVVIDVPPDSQVHKQIVRKDPGSYDIEVDPAVRMYYTEVQEPSMHDPSGDLRRLLEALEFEWRLEHIHRCDLRVLQDIQPALRKGEWAVSVAVHNENEIIAVWPGFFDKIYGLAVDIGSTTVAAHLVEMSTGEVVSSAGVMNPQIRFGEDLMSRVSYVMMNPGGEVDLTRVVREAINELVGEVCADAGVDRSAILECTFVGNPVMHHLLLGINPVELGGAPFALATDEGTTVWASELELTLHKNARAYTLPCIAGHVGADTAGVVLSEKPYLRDEMTLLVDVGTNAEIVLGNRKQLMACSSPTGPAFEGAQISSGQRAANGAIERVRIDPETKEARFKVIGCDLWSNEEGFEEAVADVGVNGICGSGIIEVIAEMYLARIINQDGVVDGRLAEHTDRVVAEGRTWSYILWRGENTIRITQNDVRQIQLGKAALYAGIRLLMDRMHVEDIERIRLAGAFGNHIDVKYAMILGLIPDCNLDNVSSAGNAAGVGARIALLDRKGRREIEDIVRKIEKVETAIEPKFQEHFVEAMAIPHKKAPFENLRRAVDLPEVDHTTQGQVPGGADSPGTRRRRRRRS